MTWHAVVGAGKYILHVELVSNPGVAVIRQNELTANSFTPSTALASGNYRAWVKAIDGVTNSFATALWSKPFNFSVASVEDSELPTEHHATLASLPKQLSPILTGRSQNQPEPSPSYEVSTMAAEIAMSTPSTHQHVADVPFIPAFAVETLTSQGDAEKALELQILDAVMGQSMLLTAMLG